MESTSTRTKKHDTESISRTTHALHPHRNGDQCQRRSSQCSHTLVMDMSAQETINDFANWRETVGFALSVLMTGLVTARSYIDQSPTQIEK